MLPCNLLLLIWHIHCNTMHHTKVKLSHTKRSLWPIKLHAVLRVHFNKHTVTYCSLNKHNTLYFWCTICIWITCIQLQYILLSHCIPYSWASSPTECVPAASHALLFLWPSSSAGLSNKLPTQLYRKCSPRFHSCRILLSVQKTTANTLKKHWKHFYLSMLVCL